MTSSTRLPFHKDKNLLRLSAAMQRAQQKATQALAAAAQKQASTPTPFILPGINETARAIPNYIARSAIFAPVRRGWRILHDDTVFLEGTNILLKGSGKQLSEDHADIWMHAIYLQTTALPGDQPVINRADFLRGMGRNTSGASYEWLHQGMKDLARFVICIEAKKRNGTVKYSYGNHPSTRVLPMIGGFDYDEPTGIYTLHIDPRWAQIFSNREYALVDWEKRLKMRHDLSKSLQRLVGTSADEIQKYSLDILKERAQYTGRVRDFRLSLERSLLELERLEIIAKPGIEISSKNQLQAVWIRLSR